MLAKLSRRSRHVAAITAVVTVSTAMLLSMPAREANAATSFTVFNETQGDHSTWALDQFGLTNNAVVYDRWGLTCSTTGCSNVPSQSTFESAITSVVSQFGASPTTPIALDFEGIVPDSATSNAQAQQDLNLYEELATWAHGAEPSAPIGMYSYDWKTAYDSYTAQLYTGGYFQFFAPTMYNRWATVADWKAELSAAVSNDKSMDSSLPIYPFIWPMWDNGSSAELSAADWTTEFRDLEPSTQGAIVWANSATTLDTTSCGWLSDLSYEMSVLDNKQSTGPLTVTAAVPNTCEISHGATTAVPLTITNNGTSTSVATTLSAQPGPQGITEAYTSAAVPALAPGASYSTTLNITVPSSVTDQTALLQINYGTGFRRLTVIVD
ncbi:NEW3 domain-containing protein [Leekyejoonella antrihumi]|nr:NEW3 domain-containing protein [Leekyejoonella antrihumi]